MKMLKLPNCDNAVKTAETIEPIPDEFLGRRRDIKDAFVKITDDGTVLVGGWRERDNWQVAQQCGEADDWRKAWHNGVKRWLDLAVNKDKAFDQWVFDKFGFSHVKMEPPQMSQEELRAAMESLPSSDIFSGKKNWFERYAGNKSRYHEERGPFSVNRDDNEMRLMVCPKCRSWDVSKITEDDKELPGETTTWRPVSWGRKWDKAYSGSSMIVMKCNSKKCGSCFALYPEDGTRSVSEKEAKQALKDGHLDMQDNGYDGHGHAPYLLFIKDPRK